MFLRLSMAEAAVDLFAQQQAGGRLKEQQQSARRQRTLGAANDSRYSAGPDPRDLPTANDGSYESAGAQLARNTQGAQSQPTSQAHVAAQFKQEQQQRRRGLRGNVQKGAQAFRKGVRQIAGAVKGAPDMIGEALRHWMDRITPKLIAAFKLIVPLIALILLLCVRWLGSFFKSSPLITFLGQLRFSEEPLLQSLAPDSKTMRPPRFTFLTGSMALAFCMFLLVAALLLIIMQIVLPLAIVYVIAKSPRPLLEFGSSDMFNLFKPMIQPIINLINPFS
mgnify:CR=1 FL=1